MNHNTIKPDCYCYDEEENIHALEFRASRILTANGLSDQATELHERMAHARNYYDARDLIGEYVRLTGPELEPGDEMELTMDWR